MQMTSKIFQLPIFLILGFSMIHGSIANAEAVYKCVNGGKVTFTSSRGDNCQSIDLKVSEPNPVDVARQQEENSRYAAEQAKRQNEQKKREAGQEKQTKKSAEAQQQALLKSLGNTRRSNRGGYGRWDMDEPETSRSRRW